MLQIERIRTDRNFRPTVTAAQPQESYDSVQLARQNEAHESKWLRTLDNKRQTITRPHWDLLFSRTDADDPDFPCSPPLFDSIRTGQRETRNSGPEARRTLVVIQTAIESSTTGQGVSPSGR